MYQVTQTLSLGLNLGTNVKDSTGPMTTVSDEELEPTQAYCMEIDGKGQTCNSVLMGKNPFILQSISNFSKDQYYFSFNTYILILDKNA